MKPLFELIRDEWPVIKQAPATHITLQVVGWSTAFAVMYWLFGAAVSYYKGQADMYREQAGTMATTPVPAAPDERSGEEPKPNDSELSKAIDLLTRYLRIGKERLSAKVGTDEEFADWKNNNNVWTAAVIRALRESISERAALNFGAVTTNARWAGYNPEHSDALRFLAARTEKLEEEILRLEDRASEVGR